MVPALSPAQRAPMVRLSRWHTDLLMGLILLAFALLLGQRELSINRWSIQAERALLNGGQPLLSAPPAEHQRATIWEGEALLATGDSDGAVKLLAPRVEETGDPLARSVLARAYGSQGNLSLTIEQWKQARAWSLMLAAANTALAEERWDDVLAICDGASEGMPQDVIAPEAWALSGKHQPAAASSLVQIALATWPSSSFRQDWLVMQGLFEGAQMHWGNAEAAFAAAAALPGKSSARAYVGLGQAQAMAGEDPAQAMATINRGIAIDPSDPAGYLALGQIVERVEGPRQAIPLYSRAQEVSPGSVELPVRLGEAYLAAGDNTAARQVLEKAAAQFPRNAEVQFLLAESYERLGLLDLALPPAEAATTLAPAENAWYWVLQGSLLERLGDRAKALDAYQSALRVDPGNSAAMTGVSNNAGH